MILSAGRWRLERRREDVGTAHGRDVGSDPVPSVWLVEPTNRALVLGSSQRDDDVDTNVAAALGVDIVRRRSGGGAVLVDPDDLVWVEVIVPRGDPLWDDDVGRAAHWLGHVWREVVAPGRPDATTHTGATEIDVLAKIVCFAGTGAGEVSCGEGKIVGISQRRTRDAARFQCACLLRWDPAPLFDLLPALSAPGSDDGWRRRVAAAGASARMDSGALVQRLLSRLAAF